MSLAAALVKLAGKALSPKHLEKLDDHFVSTDAQKWRAFNRNLRAKGFVEAVKEDLRSDDKLKRYSAAMHMHYTGKGPSTKVGKYVVKFHPETERFSCSCKDWRFARSHSGGDCKHITGLKQQMTKTASSFLRGLSVLEMHKERKHQSENEAFKARLVNQAVEKSLRGRAAHTLR